MDLKLPIGLQKEEKKAIALPSGEGTGALHPRQVNVELDCRSSALRQVSTFAARLQSACHTLSLSVINIKLFHAKCILSDMDVLRLASQSVLQLTGVGVLWKEGGVIFMSVWGWGRLDLALLHPSDCLGSLFVFCLL